MSNGLLFIIHFKQPLENMCFLVPRCDFFRKNSHRDFCVPEKKLRNDVKIRNVGNPVKKCGGFPVFCLKVHQNLHQNSIWCLFVRQCLKARVASFFRCFNRKSMLEVDFANRYGKTMVWEKNTPFHSKKIMPTLYLFNAPSTSKKTKNVIDFTCWIKTTQSASLTMLGTMAAIPNWSMMFLFFLGGIRVQFPAKNDKEAGKLWFPKFGIVCSRCPCFFYCSCLLRCSPFCAPFATVDGSNSVPRGMYKTL